MDPDFFYERVAATEDYGIAWNNYQCDEQAPNGQLIMVPLPVDDDDDPMNSLSPVPPPPVGPPADNNECTMPPSPLFAESDNELALNDNIQELNNILNTNNAIFPAPPALELDDELAPNNTDNKPLIISSNKNGIAYNITSSSSFVYNITFINNIYVNTFFVNIINTKSGTTSSSLPISIKNESSFAPTSLPIYHTNTAPPNTTNFVISPTTTIKKFKAQPRKPGFKVNRNKAKKEINGEIILKIANPWLIMDNTQFKLRKQMINGKLSKKYRCFEKYCRRRNNITQPQRHVLEMYHPERPFYEKRNLVCLECDKIFTSKYKKKIHTKSQCAENRLKPFECSTCFRRYKFSHDCSLEKCTLEMA